MVRRTLILAALATLVLTLIPLAGTAAPSDPFTGSWQAVDVDGSNMSLRFGGRAGSERRVMLSDDNATGGVCADGDGPAAARGTGEVSGDRIEGVFDVVRCVDGPGELLDVPFLFVFDPGTGTLTDGGVAWFRPGTRPSEPFLGAWQATDAGDGSAMTLSFALPIDGAPAERMVTLYDDNATGGVCTAGHGRAMGSGIGVIDPGDEDRIAGSFDALDCLDGDSLELVDLPFEYVHDPATTTISDTETTWHRPGNARRSPRGSPASPTLP